MTGTAPEGTALLVIVGPTGVGKSALASELARRLGGEIVGCDAVQVYRGLDAATAKPTQAERGAVPHHLVDCVDPRTDFTMADYVRAADHAIHDIAGRGRVPVVVGGSGLYLRGLLRGVIPAPARDPLLRERLRGIVERGGAERLRALLRRQDPVSERRIPPADVQRLVRAIELVRSGGPSWSERLETDGTWSGRPERYRALKFCLDMDREALAARLDARVDRFFDAGLTAEVRALLASGVPPSANAFKAIGYREVLAALEHGSDPEAAREAVKASTRRFAKRQRTWFRNEPGLIRVDAAAGAASLIERILRVWRPGADGERESGA